jgi:hypothetical protein
VGDDDEPDVAVTVNEARGSGLAVAGVGRFPAEPVEVIPKFGWHLLGDSAEPAPSGSQVRSG